MSGGQQRYWNEAAQRWEDAAGSTTPATPPPPPRPGPAPEAPRTPAPQAPHEPRPPQSPQAPQPPGPTGRPGGPVPVPPPAPPPVPGPWSAPELPHPGTPPPGHPSAPAPAGTGGPSRRLVWSVLGGAAAAGAAVALVLTLVVPGDDGTDDRGGRAAESASASGSAESPAPEPTALRTGETGETGQTGETASPGEPSAAVTEPPDGYEVHVDEEGFTLARPAGWVREELPSEYGMGVVNYRSSDGERRLQVYQVAESSPAASFELFLSDATPKGDGFRRLSLETLDDGDFTGSRLEYLVDSIKREPDIGPWHVVDERFVAADGEVYAIAAYGADADGREDERELLRTALGHFCPPSAACAPATGEQ
ncbi:hypothetical protein [Streptomyces sp. CA-251251]|uniref:hypothetical protein n=1 Tax=Streptomyces sp. CA-251251 TaxID=3240063 RepID=UPI003D91FD52